MPTYRFQEVRRSKTIKFKCGCGKRFQRTVAAMQTINPFNRNADGRPKTYAEIWRDLGEELGGISPDPTCPGCGNTAEVHVPREVSA